MIEFDYVRLERATFGQTISAAEAIVLLNRIAFRLGGPWGLLRAPAGGNGGQHPNGYVRLDVIAKRDGTMHVDVFINGPDREPPRNGTAEAAWQERGPFDPARWVEPVSPHVLEGNGDHPPPPPPPPPPNGEGEPTKDEIAEYLEQFLEPLENIVSAVTDMTAALRELAIRAESLEKNGVTFKFKIGA